MGKRYQSIMVVVSVLLLFTIINFSIHERVINQDEQLRSDTIRYVQEKCTPTNIYAYYEYNNSFEPELNWSEVMNGKK